MTAMDAEATIAPPRISALSPFRFPVFRGIWIASSLSNLGGLIQSVGASWLMLEIARSADMVALVQASIALPIMLLSLVAGAMADNLDRRKVMLAAQFFMLAVSIALSVCAWRELPTPAPVDVHVPARLWRGLQRTGLASAVGDMVPREELLPWR
jgi:MFS family permease